MRRRACLAVVVLCFSVAVSVGPASADPPPPPDLVGDSNGAGARSDEHGVDLNASESRKQTGPKAQPVASGPPRDSQGREYACTEKRITDENQLNSHWYIWPGGSELKPPPEDGYMVQRTCRYVDPTISEAVEGETGGYRWVTDPDLVAQAAFREEAVRRLQARQPIVRTWPSEVFVVNIPTRFRVENFETRTEPTGTTNVRVWATAVPFKAVWTFGDATVTCAFAGKAFTGNDDGAVDACKHSFYKSTDGKRVPASVQVHYHAVWSSNLLNDVPQPLPDIVSVPYNFTYQVRGYEAVIR